MNRMPTIDYEIAIHPKDVEGSLEYAIHKHLKMVAKKIADQCIILARAEADSARHIGDLGGIYHCEIIAKHIQEMIERELKDE